MNTLLETPHRPKIASRGEPAFEKPSTEKRLPTVPQLPSAEEVRVAFEARHATDEQTEIAVWVITTARSVGLTTFEAIARWLHQTRSVISKYLRGEYDADLRSITAKLSKFRDSFTVEQGIAVKPFVEGLSVVRNIQGVCEMARVTQQIALIWGDNQSGKSWALQRVADQEDRDTILFRLKAGGSVGESWDRFVEAAGFSTRKSQTEKSDCLMKRVHPSTLVAADEFHQAFIGRTLKMVLIERLREVKDVTGCGMALCGTKVFMDMMEKDSFVDFLAQIGNRGVLRLYVPTAPTDQDRSLIYRAYHLPEPDGRAKEIALEISTQNGIGKLTAYFQVARMLALKSGGPMTWKHFVTAHATLTTWAGPARNRKGNK